ncbi:helix-turn-helix domain-containing protein [Pseudomonas sp. B329]|uniref:helix-turn-helix domain-containing protein n=1 Tax=Pseudomonas sp. B329 TaxID=1553459 RepID=UPI00249ED339|nr:helix-turn-helix domain-containing protein [Pseudomonas sp. B329]MCK3865572.1 helix-turn-helix transcriptional regulator [Pseudomonas sp. B329]
MARAAINVLGATGATYDFVTNGSGVVSSSRESVGVYRIIGCLGMVPFPPIDDGWGYTVNQIDNRADVDTDFTEGVLTVTVAYKVAEASAVNYDGQAQGREGALSFVSLSNREQEVIRCYLAGMSITDIADKFNRSIKTISSQKTSAFRKLGVVSNNELFRIRHIIEGVTARTEPTD